MVFLANHITIKKTINGDLYKQEQFRKCKPMKQSSIIMFNGANIVQKKTITHVMRNLYRNHYKEFVMNQKRKNI